MKKKFTLTKEHILLLQNSYVEWNGSMSGAACIDCKRPYGDTDTPMRIAEILKWKLSEAEKNTSYLRESYTVRALRLHEETEIALQIILSTKSFKVGTYEKEDEYDALSWRLVK